MEMKLNKIPTERKNTTLAAIKGTKYLVLDDGTPVSILKPTVINNKDYFNLIVDGKMKRISREKLIELNK